MLCDIRLIVFHFNNDSLSTALHVVAHFLQRIHMLAKATFAKWLFTLYRLVLDLLHLDNSHATPFADNLHVLTLVQLVGPEQ